VLEEEPLVEPLEEGELEDGELELELGGVALEPLDFDGLLLSLPQPASANATAAANSSDVFII
jgi:hypothetical protein